MTRKRFIKLLMAQGYSRNEARELARFGYEGQPYTEKYFLVCRMYRLPEWLDYCARVAHLAGEAAAELLRVGMAEAIPRFVQAVVDGTRQIVENMDRLKEAAEGKPSE